MAGELKRLDRLAEVVERDQDAKAIRALLHLVKEQHELLVQYDNTIDCINCYPTDLEVEHEDYCNYARVMAQYKEMGGE